MGRLPANLKRYFGRAAAARRLMMLNSGKAAAAASTCRRVTPRGTPAPSRGDDRGEGEHDAANPSPPGPLSQGERGDGEGEGDAANPSPSDVLPQGEREDGGALRSVATFEPRTVMLTSSKIRSRSTAPSLPGSVPPPGRADSPRSDGCLRWGWRGRSRTRRNSPRRRVARTDRYPLQGLRPWRSALRAPPSAWRWGTAAARTARSRECPRARCPE